MLWGRWVGLAVLLLALAATPASAKTHWLCKPGTNTCSGSDGADVLQISPLNGAPVLNPVPDATWGLHFTDVNIALGDLVDLTATQARAYEAKHTAK